MATTVLSLAGFAVLIPASAATPGDYGLHEGDTISAIGSADPDIYIVNQPGYKRLFLNPVIFNFYGHLGGFAKVKSVAPATRDAFPTSGLFTNCETNDGKVYGVEVTGEDTGMLHWVNVTGAAAVAADPNFFNKVFCINNNEFNWYPKGSDYTSASQVPNYTRAGVTVSPSSAPGSVNVSLASDNPAPATITGKANGVTYLKLNLSGTGTLASVRVVRHGPGKTSDFSNVYLFDGAQRLTSGRTPSSADGSVTFSNLNIAVNGSKVLSVVADMSTSGATQGDVNYFAVDSSSDISLTSGTVGGSFPVAGNNFTVSGQNGGVVQIDNSGSLGNPNVGQSHAEVAEFKLTANTEGAKIYHVQLLNAGTIKSTDMTNLSIEVNGTKVASGYMTSGGYAVFDFGSSPYTIAKGDNRIFKVYTDLAGKKADTVNFYLETTSDLLAVGDQFGFGMSVTNNLSAGSSGQTLTLQGGVLTLSFVGPTASNVSTTTTKTHFLDFDMSSAANIELRQHQVTLCMDDTGNGTYDNNADTTNGWPDLQNVQIINRDTGLALVGPADGSSFTTSDTVSCPDGATGAKKTFTDTFNINAGQTLHLAVVGDVKVDSTTSETGDIASGAVIKAVLVGYGTQAGSSGSLTVARYANTNTAVTSSDIVPSGNVSGNNLTVRGSSLALALAGNPSSGLRRFVKGTKNVNVVGFSFASSQGSPLNVSSVTLTGYVGDSDPASSSPTMTKSAATGADSNITVSGLTSAIRLVDGETGQVISSNPTTNNLSNNTSTAKFDSLNWAVPAGSTKTLLVQVDLSTNAVSGQYDALSFDIAATSDVTAIDQNSNSINAGNAAVNGTNGNTTYVSSFASGTLTPALAADTPAAAPVYWNQQGAPYSKFKMTSTLEGFYLETLNLYTTTGSNTLVNNIDSVTVSYLNKNGQTVTATQGFVPSGGSTASTSFSFSGDSRPYVPKDGVLYLTVTANVKPASTLFRKTGVNFSIDFSGGAADEFRAVGEGSGTVIDGSAAAVVNVGANAMYVYRSYPQFTYISTPATTIAVGQEVLKFKVDAIGSQADGATVFFDGATGAASGSVRFGITASGTAAATTKLGFDLRRVTDASGSSVDQLVATRSLTSGTDTEFNTPGTANNLASLSMRFQDVAGNQSIEIPAGSSNTFVLRLNTVTGFSKPFNSNTGRAADFVQVFVKNDAGADNACGQVTTSNGSLVCWTDKGGGGRNESNGATANILKNLPINGTRVVFQ